MEAVSNYNIKELHEKTGHYIRLAGKSPTPISITDRGKVVAVISSPDLVIPRPRIRKYSKEFQDYFESALSKNSKRNSIQDDLDAIRGDL